jgi:hypothetical protein
LWDVFIWRKIGSVDAVFFFCYFSFGQAKEKQEDMVKNLDLKIN